ncbi:MAG: Rv1355c family protein [Flavobacteriales bacterium]|nr:Rv1355c family protein [Flavobacteriales bacterium]
MIKLTALARFREKIVQRISRNLASRNSFRYYCKKLAFSRMSSNLTNILRHQGNVATNDCCPDIFRISRASESQALEHLLNTNKSIQIYDSINSQLRDLVKLRNPNKSLSEVEYDELISSHVGKVPIEEYGVWVYYKWSNKLIHILDEKEFIEVRTIRNCYKITPEEQELLKSKKVGIIGLSAGQSIAMAIAQERICGEIRIADFDLLELSNLNRIRSSIDNINLLKTTIVARAIMEIDPYLKVVIFDGGINSQNIRDFIHADGKIDLLIEECDSLEIKILARIEAKKSCIPVLMDTSDRGMIDIERFDLDANYPILHGLVNESIPLEFYASLKTSEEKLPYILPILGIDSLSTRLAASGLQVGDSITTWPQLYSDVTFGGAASAAISRRLLLGEEIKSGRTWIDLNEIFAVPDKPSIDFKFEEPLSVEQILNICASIQVKVEDEVPKDVLQKVLSAAIKAPSAGNNQKWKFVIKNSGIIVLIDKKEALAFSDNLNIASLINVGCSIENIEQQSKALGWATKIEYLGDSYFPAVASISFYKSSSQEPSLADQINSRCTTRSNSAYYRGDQRIYSQSEAQLSTEFIKLKFEQDPSKIQKIGNLICKADRIRFLNTQGHQEFFKHEIRWTTQESTSKKDGLDINQFELNVLDRMGLNIVNRLDVINFLNTIDGGESLEKISSKCFKNADSIGYTLTKGYGQVDLINTGQLIERFWLLATKAELGIFPMTVIPMMTSLVNSDKNNYLSEESLNNLREIQTEISILLDIPSDWRLTFMMRTNGVEPNQHRSPRHELDAKTIIV